MYCEDAFIQDRKILCRQSGITCAHVHFCGITMKWSQTEAAKICPGNPERKGGQHGTAGKTAEKHSG